MLALHRLILTAFCILITIPQISFSAPGEFSGPVVSVLDGATIDVRHNGQSERIRLNGIDAPEMGQPYGK
jgi:endonuclease YncB( thermonuclease family)